MKWQRRCGNSQPNLEIKLVFTFEIGYLRKPEVIEDIPATDRAAEVDLEKKDSDHKDFGG